MHVCVLTPVLDAFKGGNHLPLLAAMPDIQFTILTNRTKPKNPDLPPNVKVETVKGRLGSYYYGWSDFLFARSVLKRYPARHSYWKQFDVIHLNQTMGPALLRLPQSGVPVCLLIHHPVTADRQVAIEESGFAQGLLWRLKYAALIAWQSRLCRALPHVVTVSHTAADRIASDYGCSREKICVVENGVDAEEFRQSQDEEEFDVISLGSFVHPRKGFRYLEAIYRKLAQEGFCIADVGRRSDEQRKTLQAIPNLRSFGTVEQAELLSLMQRSKVLISTSLYEGFGLSLIEALACGKPAFAFDAGAVKEVLAPIDPSLVSPLRDTTSLVRHVVAFLRLPAEERQRRGNAYRRAIEQRFPLRASAAALRAFYERIKAA